MEEECDDIKKNAMTLAWYMRGSIQYQDVLNMSIAEHKSINKIIESNMETTQKSGLNFF